MAGMRTAPVEWGMHNWTPPSMRYLALLTQENPCSGRAWEEVEVVEGIAEVNRALDYLNCRVMIARGGLERLEKYSRTEYDGRVQMDAEYRRAELRGELCGVEMVLTLSHWKGEWNGGWANRAKRVPEGEAYRLALRPKGVIRVLSVRWPDLADDLALILERMNTIQQLVKEVKKADKAAMKALYD